MMNCDSAREILADAARKKVRTPDEMDAAIRHAATCPLCQRGLRSLVGAVLSSRDDEIPCAEARVRMTEHLKVATLQEGLPAAMEAVDHHLKTCPDCAMEYALMKEMRAWAAEEPLYRSAAAPHFDLSFVDQPAPLWERISGHASRLADTLRIRIAAGTVALEGFSRALDALQPAPAYAVRGEASEGEPARTLLTIPDEEQRLLVRLGVSAGGEAKADLTISVEPLAAGQTLPRVRVSLQNEYRQLLERRQSIERQSVVFEGVSAGKYWLVVQVGDHEWQISVPISGEGEA